MGTDNDDIEWPSSSGKLGSGHATVFTGTASRSAIASKRWRSSVDRCSAVPSGCGGGDGDGDREHRGCGVVLLVLGDGNGDRERRDGGEAFPVFVRVRAPTPTMCDRLCSRGLSAGFVVDREVGFLAILFPFERRACFGVC